MNWRCCIRHRWRYVATIEAIVGEWMVVRRCARCPKFKLEKP